MKICILSENSYPVSTGGVSEWCDYLVKGMPENRFHILTIASSKQFKYNIPSNVEVNAIEMNQPRFDQDILDKPVINNIMDTLKHYSYVILPVKGPTQDFVSLLSYRPEH